MTGLTHHERMVQALLAALAHLGDHIATTSSTIGGYLANDPTVVESAPPNEGGDNAVS